MPKMLTPMSSIRTMDRMMKMRPMIADVMISLPAFSLSGIPAEVVMMKVP